MARIRQIEAQRGLSTGSIPSTQIDNSVGAALGGLGAALGARAEMDSRMETRRLQMAMENSEFKAEQDFQQFKQDFAGSQAEALTNIDPSGEGYTKKVAELYEQQSQEFLNKVPGNIRPRIGELLETHRNGMLNGAAAQEADQRNTWFKQGVSKRGDELVAGVIENPAMYEASLSEGQRLIDTSGLPPVEKEALREGLKTALLLGKAENYKRTDPSRILGGQTAGGDWKEQAKALLRKEEGFRGSPYWDVNANRAGYGSDTTIVNGKPVKVTEDTKVSRQQAEADLEYRLTAREGARAQKQLGSAWGLLPSNVQAALASVAYNYGSLPDSVVTAAKGGDISALATAVENLSSNPDRRKREAAIIRGGTIELSDEFAELPANAQLKLYDEAIAAQNSLATAQAAQAKAQYESMKDSVDLGIATGQITSRVDILSSGLNDGDKAVMIRRLGDKNTEEADISSFIGRVSAGEGAEVNPYDTSERGIADKAYDKIVKTVDPENAGAVERAFVNATGYIPKQVVADLRNGAATDDPKSFMEAMQRADELDRSAPKALDAIDGASDVRKALEQYRAKVETLGMTSEQAAKAVLDSRKPENQVSRDLLKTEAGKFLKDLSATDVTDALDQGLLDWEPDLPLMPAQQNALMAEYREVAESAFYDTAGDADAAKKIALADMKKRWGVSRVTGDKRVMRLPPENFYPPVGGSHAYVRDDALKSAQEWAGEAFPDRSVGNVTLVPDRATRADVEAGKPPRYRLFYSYENDVGATVYDEVPGGYWQMDTDALKEMTGAQQATSRAEFDALRGSAAMAEDGGRAASLDAFLNGPVATPDNPNPVAPAAASAPEPIKQKTTAGGRIADQLPITDPTIADTLNAGGGGGF